MNDLQSIFVVALAAATLRSTAPLLLAAMGGLLSERSGVMNIGLEGFMLLGAFGAAAGSYFTGQPFVGLAVGMLVSGLAGAVYAYWAITLRADQIVSGTAINLLGVGLTAFLVQRIWGQAGGSPTVTRLPTTWLDLSILVPVAFAIVPVVWWLLRRTKPGLRIMASGESPRAAESVGIDVPAYRYACVIAAGALAGLGGAYLSIGDLSQFTTNMTAGRGFIALGAVLLGARHPVGAMLAALLFGVFEALSIVLPSLFGWIPSEFIQTIPFLVTILALILFSYRAQRARLKLAGVK